MAEAHHLKSLALVGHKGIEMPFVDQVKQLLLDHELVKVKFNDHKERKEELSEKLAIQSGAQRVGLLGNTAILFREHPKPELRRYSLI